MASLTEIQARIYMVRGVQVMLDRDLAVFYKVDTGQLNRQVKRNIGRFPEDFMFQLTKEEWKALLNTTNYSWVWTTDYNGSGKNGMLVTRLDNASGTDPCASNSIFLSAAGFRDGTSLTAAGPYGDYWSSSLNTDYPDHAWSLNFLSGSVGMYNDIRSYGFSIRPVSE